MFIKVCKSDDSLKPWDDEDKALFSRLKTGIPYTADIKRERNHRFHRLYMGFLRKAWEFLNERQSAFFKESFDGFRKSVELTAGCYEPIYNATTNEWIHSHKSISFRDMSQEEFEDLYERVKDVVFRLFLSHISAEDYENNFSEF